MAGLPGDAKDPRFYQAELSLDRIPQAFVSFMQSYSNIKPSNLVKHIVEVRDEAYRVRHYPCLGRFRFLELDLSTHPLYSSQVLPILKTRFSAVKPFAVEQPADASLAYSSLADKGAFTTNAPDTTDVPLFLDLGTCLGQDVRKLIHDGVPVSQVYAADIDPLFIEAGYKLFRDEHKLPRAQFLTDADVFAPSSPDDYEPRNQKRNMNSLSRLDNKITILHCTAVFHLFDLEDQKRVARRCLRLLRKTPLSASDGEYNDDDDDSNSMLRTKRLILGGQVGNLNAFQSSRKDGKTAYRHNEQSWRDMWNEIVSEDEWKRLGTKVDVESTLVSRSFADIGNKTAENEGDGKTAWNSKVVGREEDGFRWHVYSVWVEFEKANL